MSRSRNDRQSAKRVFRAWTLCKQIYHSFPRSVDPQKILFILGCQRSGTTLATRVFEHDWHAKVFGEFSELSSDDSRYGIRLNSLEKVERTIRSQHYPLVVAKPLVESQRAPELLQRFGNSKIVWLYRSYLDVASSDLAKFGERNGIDNIRPIVVGAPGDWRSENVSESTRKTLALHFREDMNKLDAAALFWYSRNKLFFDAKLSSTTMSDRVMPVSYEELTAKPHMIMQDIYRFVVRPYPGPHIVAEVDPGSVDKGRGRHAEISDSVRKLCASLLVDLDEAARYSRPRV